VVAATNGISGIIAPDGHVLRQAAIRTRAVLVDRVGLSTDITPAVRIGPWSGRLCVLVTGLGLALGAVDYRRKRTGS
jgi:apolipoprotein N-acyltransferase